MYMGKDLGCIRDGSGNSKVVWVFARAQMYICFCRVACSSKQVGRWVLGGYSVYYLSILITDNVLQMRTEEP